MKQHWDRLPKKTIEHATLVDALKLGTGAIEAWCASFKQEARASYPLYDGICFMKSFSSWAFDGIERVQLPVYFAGRKSLEMVANVQVVSMPNQPETINVQVEARSGFEERVLAAIGMDILRTRLATE